MTFFAFGLNHETAPVADREAFAFDAAALRAVYRSLAFGDEAEGMLLSTCNRTEAYLYGGPEEMEAVQAALSERAGLPWPSDAAFFYRDEDAIRHVLEVTAGLRSLVPGDAQILAQVKEAYRLATGEERVGAVMHRLLHTAFRAAKRVINETALSNGAASVPAAAVAEARRYFETFSDDGLAGRRVLLVGAGRMGCLALEALRGLDLAQVAVANRSSVHAHRAARLYDARLVAWDARYHAAGEADLVIVASGAEEPVLWAEAMPARPPESPSSPATLVVDIAVPRNADPGIGALPGYRLMDLDALNADVLRVEAHRRDAVPAARRICDEALAEYVAWVFHQQALQPAVHAIRETFEAIRVQEIERHQGRFSDIDRAELDRLTTSIIQKLLAVPVVRLKNVDPNSIDFVRGIKLLHALFSRPTCEDESAEAVPPDAALLHSTTPPESPAQCPFPEAADGSDEQLRQALQVPFRGERP